MRPDLEAFLARARGGAAVAPASSGDDVGAVEKLQPPSFCLGDLRGRLVEVSGRGATAVLTAAIGLVLEAQLASEPVAWMTLTAASFYPPDVAESGVDLEALVVIRAREVVALTRAAERLLRSSAFGLVVLDLGGAPLGAVDIPLAHQGRLVTLAQQHDAAVVCLTEKTSEASSLGSLVSLRAEALRQRDREGFSLTMRAIKDKRRGPGWSQAARRRGPPGML